MPSNDNFSFRQFTIYQSNCAMKVGTDGVILGAWATGGNNILDIGCGTGLLSLMMAQRYRQSIVKGIEIDYNASIQADENVKRSIFSDRVVIENVSLQDFIKKNGGSTDSSFDAIVCNPPYFSNAIDCKNQQRSLARHSDSLPIKELLLCSQMLLTPTGALSIILPMSEYTKLIDELAFTQLFLHRRTFIKTTESKSPNRVLLSFRPYPSQGIVDENVCLTDCFGNKSQWYQELTKDFYL